MTNNQNSLYTVGEAIGRAIRPLATPANLTTGALDMLGLIPALNIPCEIASGLISLGRRDYVGFGLSVAGLVPVQGEWAIGMKIARHAHQMHGTAKLAAQVMASCAHEKTGQSVLA